MKYEINFEKIEQDCKHILSLMPTIRNTEFNSDWKIMIYTNHQRKIMDNIMEKVKKKFNN